MQVGKAELACNWPAPSNRRPLPWAFHPHASLLCFPADQLPKSGGLDCISLLLSLSTQGSGPLLGVSPAHCLETKLVLQSQELASNGACSQVEGGARRLCYLEHREA